MRLSRKAGDDLRPRSLGHDAGLRLRAPQHQSLDLIPKLRIAFTLHVVGSEDAFEP